MLRTATFIFCRKETEKFGDDICFHACTQVGIVFQYVRKGHVVSVKSLVPQGLLYFLDLLYRLSIFD